MNYKNLVNEKKVFQYNCVLCYDFEECYLRCIPEKEMVTYLGQVVNFSSHF